MTPEEQKAEQIITHLKRSYGTIEWWPGDPEEVMIGAILTQQTRWENVEIALRRLREAGVCSLRGIDEASDCALEHAIFCTGFYRIKRDRLKCLARTVLSNGGIEQLREYSTPRLRAFFLAIKGIGPETADSILCYGFNRPVFVIDAYTHRICACAGISLRGEDLQALFQRMLPEDYRAHRQCHAWFVEYAKKYCIKKRCNECMISNF
ncbi:endonuclease III domain-containing protein [Methanogenium organophilum]|uniref:Fe-S cluster assembly protein HesB n=1 Tax=Methanogenium organophilum TaxID=2199 RepID=A0A9X9S4I1_METOG|nr:Fe-S cluster assembly protein HesB [Methanogenium organophilum]WAI01531.1 Fe-S cluster assembly protein HesB [Methanogenium organophilum]